MLTSHSKKSVINRFHNSPVIRGTFILTITGFATRIIGFYNRIFLNNLIGAKELGIYQLIFPLYMIAFSLTTFGNELALTKLVSEYISQNKEKTANIFFRICLLNNLILSLLVSIIMYQKADFLCSKILNAPECVSCLKTICFGLPFMSVKGAIHGYYLGKKKSSVHGISDFLEQLAKVFGLYILSTFFCIQMHYPASFAVLGIIIGEIVSFTYSALYYLLHEKKASVNKILFHSTDTKTINHSNTKERVPYLSKCITIFYKNALPLTTNRLFLTILQGIEAILIPTMLLTYYQDSSLSLSIYGIFTGIAFPFIMFPSTITNSLSTMLLPAVSSAKAGLQKKYLSKLCETSLHFCLLIGLYSMVAFYMYGKEIGNVLFHNADAGNYLFTLSFLCPFLYLATTLASILNGLGYITHNLLLTLFATILRISFIIFLIPKIGIIGYILGLFCSYFTLTILSLQKLQASITIHIQFLQNIVYPFLSFTLAGFCSHWLNTHLLQNLHYSSYILLFFSFLTYSCIAIFPLIPGIIKTYQTTKNYDS